MTKYLPWIVFGFTLIGALWGGGITYGKVQSKAEAVKETVIEVKARTEKLEETNASLDKSLGEITIEQKYIKEKVNETNDRIKLLIDKLDKKR